MSKGYRRLLALQRRIHDFSRQEAADDGVDESAPDHPLCSCDDQYLSIAPMRNGLHVAYFGNSWDEPWEWVLQCLSEQPVADVITSLSFSGPDEGANGTREWEFTALLDGAVRFPILRSLHIRPTAPEDHNISLIQRAGTILSEAGEIARFAAKAPYLSELVVPNAPNADFFDVPLPHLLALRIGGNADTQDFIANLARASKLPRLATLDFTESSELQGTWAERREVGTVTSPAAYRALLAAPVADTLSVLRLRNTCLSLIELHELQALRPSLQFMVIQATMGGYVSHFARDVFPWRHLIQVDPGLR